MTGIHKKQYWSLV